MHIVLTGSSSGIGRALVERLVSHGHQVWGLARRNQDPLTAGGSKPAGSFRDSKCDVSDWIQTERVAREVAAVWPHVDALVTCAGVQGEVGRALTADPRNWAATVQANLSGTFHSVRAFAQLLGSAPRRAKVVCFSGGGATKARPNFSAYAAAKTGVVRLVETIAEEERARPFDINAIAPGAINTRMTEEVLALGPAVVGEAEYAAAVKHKQTGGASLAQALDLVEWLLSPASDGVSGRFLSAQWDAWQKLTTQQDALASSDLYTLRRVTPADRPTEKG